MRTAAAINPLLAMDAKVNFGPIFKGLTTKNFKERRPTILTGLKKAVAGKTIAKDASLEHVANFLDTFEAHPVRREVPGTSRFPSHSTRRWKPPRTGRRTLGIPKKVGKEFSEADKGKTFGDMIKDWASAKDWSGGMSDDDVEALKKMHTDAMPKALDGEEDIEIEQGEDAEEEEEEAEDGDLEEEEEAEDEDNEDPIPPAKKAAKDKAAKDKAAKDRKNAKDRKGAMDKRPITQDELNKALASAQATERKAARATAEAREFVRPYVGAVSMAMDTADQILRAAAKAMNIEDAETVHPSALKQLIKMAGQTRTIAQDQQPFQLGDGGMAFDEGGAESFNKFFPGAARIGAI